VGRGSDALHARADTLGLIDAGKRARSVNCAGGSYYALEQARAGADFKALVCSTSPIPIRSLPTRLFNSGRVLAIHGPAPTLLTPKPMMMRSSVDEPAKVDCRS